MTIFLTGGSGFIGGVLLQRLIQRGDDIRVLIRPHTRFTVDHPRVHVLRGDLNDVAVMRKGMHGCDLVFHLAALVRLQARNRASFDQSNVEGTRHLMEAAAAEKVAKVIYTSSVLAIGPSDGGIAGEKTARSGPYLTDYERTKALAEVEVMRAISEGVPAVIVAPSLVFGPGPSIKLSSFNRFLSEFLTRRWGIIPGHGDQIINPVYIDDVVDGHLLAAEHGKIGEKYILGGENVTVNDLTQKIKNLREGKPKLFHLPLSVMWGFSWIEYAWAAVQGRDPLFSPDTIEICRHDWGYSSGKAFRELGYRPIPLIEGLEKMRTWLTKERKRRS